jgi:DNA-binding protein HU-beta
MDQIRDEPRLADKIFDEHFLARVTRADDLDGDALDEIARAVLLALIDDAHAALKNFADDFVVKFVLYGEQRHPPMVENWLAKSSPTAGRQNKTSIFCVFFLARSPRSPLIRAKSHDFLNQTGKITTTTTEQIMAKALSKSQLVAAIAEKAMLSKKQAGEILDHLASLAYKHAKDTFTLPGIGKLVLKNRAARMGRNPKTGEAIQIKAKRVVKFRVAKAAKDAILGAK